MSVKVLDWIDRIDHARYLPFFHNRPFIPHADIAHVLELHA